LHDAGVSCGAAAAVLWVRSGSPADVQASGAHMGAICEELEASGEFVGAERLTGRNAAKLVTYDGVGRTGRDGPSGSRSEEFLAGYSLVDVESEERALEIADVVVTRP
jgi:hypothetical protein